MNATPRLAEDADTLIREAFRFLDDGQYFVVAALLDGDHDELVAAAQQSIRTGARAGRFFAMGLHVDLLRVA